VRPVRTLLSGCAIALLATSCSSGEGQRASPTTSRPTTGAAQTSPSTQPTNKGNSTQAVRLGSCPAHIPRDSLMQLNAAAVGLADALVPFVPTTARVCRYDGWDGPPSGNAHLSVERARQLARAANALPLRRGGGCAPGVFYLTFADATRRVEVEQAFDPTNRSPCTIGPTNGTWGGGRSTQKWLGDLLRLTHDTRETA